MNGNKPVSKSSESKKTAQGPCKESEQLKIEDLLEIGDLERVTSAIISEGINPNTTIGTTGNYPLGIAASKGHLNICKFLIESLNANINQRAADGATALLLASRHGSVPVMKFLISLGSNVTEADNEGLTPLSAASMYGHNEAVQLLLNRAAPPKKDNLKVTNFDESTGGFLNINSSDNDGFTALMYAASNGHTSVIKMLLSHDANVNATNKEDATALYFSCKGGHLAATKALLNSKANPDGKKEINGEFQHTFSCGPPLYVAAENGHFEVVKALVEFGADINLPCIASGATPLYVASEEGHLKIVKYIVSAGTPNGQKTDINARNIQDASPLFIACYKGYADIAKTLLLAGADACGSFSGGASCLFVASQNGHLKIVKLLLEHRKQLIDEGSGSENILNIDAQVQSQMGMTALCVASDRGFYDIVKALVGAGANISLKVGRNEDCLRIANERGHIKISEYITQMLGQQKKIARTPQAT